TRHTTSLSDSGFVATHRHPENDSAPTRPTWLILRQVRAKTRTTTNSRIICTQLNYRNGAAISARETRYAQTPTPRAKHVWFTSSYRVAAQNTGKNRQPGPETPHDAAAQSRIHAHSAPCRHRARRARRARHVRDERKPQQSLRTEEGRHPPRGRIRRQHGG